MTSWKHIGDDIQNNILSRASKNDVKTAIRLTVVDKNVNKKVKATDPWLQDKLYTRMYTKLSGVTPQQEYGGEAPFDITFHLDWENGLGYDKHHFVTAVMVHCTIWTYIKKFTINSIKMQTGSLFSYHKIWFPIRRPYGKENESKCVDTPSEAPIKNIGKLKEMVYMCKNMKYNEEKSRTPLPYQWFLATVNVAEKVMNERGLQFMDSRNYSGNKKDWVESLATKQPIVEGGSSTKRRKSHKPAKIK